MSKRPAVDLLPPEIRTLLEQELRRRGFGQLDAIVALLSEHGIQVSRSAIGRFSQRLQRQMETIQAATEAARAIAGIVDDTDDRSAAAIALVQSQMFEALLSAQEVADEEDPAARVQVLGKAARAIADLGRASVTQKRWAQGVRDKIDSALIRLEQDKPSAGKVRLDPETLRVVRDELYGVIF